MRLLLLTLLSTLPLTASSSVVGGQLLNVASATQLASWLGQGDLIFNNIFSSTPVSNGSTLFHNAVDGQGATFILIQTNRGLVGGYDPVSWSTSFNYVIDNTDNGRTAFIFNLSTTTKLTQRLVAQATTPDGDTGIYQTFNYSVYGPAFGGGHDLVAYSSDLSAGYAYSYSYGNARGGANIFGVSNASLIDPFNVTRLEAFTFAPANATPEPASLAICAGGLLLLAAWRQRRA